jgi:hypothetical protein
MAVRKGDTNSGQTTEPQAEPSATPASQTPKATPAKSTEKSSDVVLYKSGNVVTYEPAPLPGNRPVFASHLPIVHSDSLPNRRPVMISDIQVTSLDHLPHHRPVFKSELDIVAMSGDRPIIRLAVPLEPSPNLPENRPIATGPWLEHTDLMGFLD